MKLHYLMHQDDLVAIIQMDESGRMNKVKIVEPVLIPPQGKLSIQALRKWWEYRAVPITQEGVHELLQKAGVLTPSEFLYKSLGLSMTDHYWIQPCETGLKWKDINLFKNDFHDITEIQEDTLLTPASSLGGELRKKWVVGQKGERFLIKEGKGANAQQSINECFASYLHQKQGFDNYVDYNILKLNKRGVEVIGCYCRAFTSDQYELFTAFDICSSHKKSNDQSEYEHFIKVCTIHGMIEADVRTFLEYQIMTDFIITNTDRHLNNFGIIRDANSLNYIAMAPIYDSGNSMLWDFNGQVQGKALLNIPVNSFLKKETDHLNYITNRECVNLARLPSAQEIHSLYSESVTKEKLKWITKSYEEKIHLVMQFQLGKDISSYRAWESITEGREDVESQDGLEL